MIAADNLDWLDAAVERLIQVPLELNQEARSSKHAILAGASRHIPI